MEDEKQITLFELLDKMTEMGGSDLHLRVDSPPQVRLHGKLQRLEGYPSLNPEDTEELAYSVLSEVQKKRFEEKLELDFSFSFRGLSRFRVNIFCTVLY